MRFPFQDGNHLTEDEYYDALIVTPESSTAPTMLKLGNAKVLEGAAD